MGTNTKIFKRVELSINLNKVFTSFQPQLVSADVWLLKENLIKILVMGKLCYGKSNEQEGALRELKEETGLGEKDIKNFRQIAKFSFKGGKDSYWENGYSIAYFDAKYDKEELPECDEGDLSWVSLNELGELDIIDYTKAALELFKEVVFGKNITEPFTGEFLESGRGVTDTFRLRS